MELPNRMKLNRENLVDRINKYGFIECGCMLSFLHVACDQILDRASFLYIKGKVDECLGNHQMGIISDYFDDMINLSIEIDYILSLAW